NMGQTDLNTSGVQRPGAFFGHMTQTIRDLAVQRFSVAKKGLTLDVGCGNGLFFASLPQPTGRLVGIDLDLDLLFEAKRIFVDNQIEDVRLVQGNVTTLPFPDKTFDNIFFLNTLINIPTDEIVQILLDELMRICRPAGRIFVDIRNGANPVLKMRYWLHNRREDFCTRGYHLRQMGGIFAAKGFQIVHRDHLGLKLPFAALGYLLEVQAPG
ncbi:MAG: class I SAM-dependent methyltransferase, partial [bacterium]|nr:class I SAM-dependent methyltransferase [bacterium]